MLNIFKLLIPIINLFLKIIYNLPYTKKLFLFQSYDLYSYNDNSKYLYEYLSARNYNCLWITKSNELISYLNKKNYKSFKYDKNLLRVFFLLLRTKIIFDNGTNYFSPLNIDIKKIIKINLGHGSGPKINFFDTGDKKKNIQNIKKINSFTYFNFTSDFTVNHLSKSQNIFSNNLINYGYPRLDVQVNTENLLLPLKNYKKVISYTPTWRSYKSNLPISLINDFDFKNFNDFLKDNNFCFIYSIHPQFVFKDKDHIGNHSNILNFSSLKNFDIDINHLLKFSDILINDYSTTTTDASFYKVPQVYIYNDYEEFTYSNGFVEDFKSVNPGPEINDFADLKNTLLKFLNSPEVYFEKYGEKLDNYLIKYYDIKNSNSLEKFENFLSEI